MNETIAAIATPNAVGGLSVIRISGPEAIAVTDQIFRPVSGIPLCEHKGYTAAYGTAIDAAGEIDNTIAVVYRAPRSYTGENVVELSCRGGIIVTRRLLRAALDAGARLAEAGEFTKRAFLNGKMSLTQACLLYTSSPSLSSRPSTRTRRTPSRATVTAHFFLAARRNPPSRKSARAAIPAKRQPTR